MENEKTADPAGLPARVFPVSLGCPKNLVDTEHLLGLLDEQGLKAVEDETEADIILVNTCGFIQEAVEESIETLLDLAALKEESPEVKLVAFGCLPERYKSSLVEEMVEVDLFWGSGDLAGLARALSGFAHGLTPWPDRAPGLWSPPGFIAESAGPRLRSAPFYRTYLKTAEGCSNRCAYCLIPSLRGPYRSRSLEGLLAEAAALAESGVKELILTAQDVTAYGRDLGNRTDLALLLIRLAEIGGLEWIRIMYAYPTGVTDRLLEVMASEPKVCPYLDLPLQHASPGVLELMGRPASGDCLSLVERIRAAVPEVALRTTLMVGFPGETQEDFEILLDFAQKARFNNLGVFEYSPEEGTRAATRSDQVPAEIKKERSEKLADLQKSISLEHNSKLVGRTLPVLQEGYSEETDLLLVGRTRFQAPEIDGVVYVNKGRAVAGTIRPVLITEAHEYDLIGEIVE